MPQLVWDGVLTFDFRLINNSVVPDSPWNFTSFRTGFGNETIQGGDVLAILSSSSDLSSFGISDIAVV